MQEQNNNFEQQPQQPPPQNPYPQQPPPPQYQQPNQYAQQPPPGYPPQQPYGDMPPEMAAQKDANDNKLMAILSYFSLLWLVPFLTKAHETSPFVKFHLNQGILLVGLQVVYWVLHILLGLFRTTRNIYGAFGLIIAQQSVRPWWVVTITSLLSLFILVLAIIGIVNAAKGEQKKLPLIGDLFTLLK